MNIDPRFRELRSLLDRRSLNKGSKIKVKITIYGLCSMINGAGDML